MNTPQSELPATIRSGARLGIARRTGIHCAVIVVLVAAVLSLRGYFVNNDLTREGAQERADHVGRAIAAGCGRPLITGDTETLVQIVTDSQVSNRLWVHIDDHNRGRVVDGVKIALAAGEEVVLPDTAHLITSERVVRYGDRTVGYVIVVVSVIGIEARLVAAGVGEVGVAALLALLVYFVASSLLTRTLRPLSELARATRELSAGSFDVQVPVRSDDELGLLAESFNDMAETLCATVVHREALEAMNLDVEKARRTAEASDRAKSEFLANMSHEIRTPMTAILGYAEVLLENATAPDLSEAARTIHQNGRHLLAILDDILDISKVEAGHMTVELIECSPIDIGRQVASLMRVRAAAKNLELSIVWRAPVPETIASDPTRLRQVLVNLVGNAVKFTETGSVQLVIGLARDGAANRIEFEVIDTGIGLDATQVRRIFEPFAQGDERTTRRFGGTGLGLTISRRLVELLGGEIRVHSEPGAGSRFVVSLPTGPLNGVRLLSDPEAELEESSKPAKAIPSTGKPLRDLRVLLAEDGPDNQKLISFLLRKLGSDVEVAPNGRVAYEMALSARAGDQSFDVILMDMHMPEMDGYTATAKLREEGYEGGIVALTANAMEGDEQRCRDAGCDAYTTKPIQRDELVQALLLNARRGKP